MSMVVLSPMAIDIYLSSIPQMAIELAASNSQIQSTIAIFFFAVGFGQLAVGPLADRYGRKMIALAGLCGYVGSALAAALADDIFYLQLFRALQGLASCAISVVIFSVVRDRYSYARSSKIYSYLNGVLSIIPALAPILGSILAQSFGWRATFVFMAGYSLLVLLVVAKFLPETLKTSDKLASQQFRLYSFSRFKKVLIKKSFVYYALCSMTGMAGILSYVSYAPIWLIQHLQLSEEVFSLLFGFNPLVSIIACFLAPSWISVYGNRFMVMVGLTLMLISAVLIALLYLLGFTGMMAGLAFMLPVVLLSVGLALSIGPASSIALSSFGGSAGTAAAVLGFIQMAGAAVIISLIQLTDLSAPFAVSVILLVLVVPLLLISRLTSMYEWHKEPLAE